MTEIINQHKELEKRRTLRNNMPEAEQILWAHLRSRQIGGVRFRRQVSMKAYVLDFYCPALKLAIEVDGSSHDGEDAQEYDYIRQKTIEGLGIVFLRFSNADVRNNLESVIAVIQKCVYELQA